MGDIRRIAGTNVIASWLTSAVGVFLLTAILAGTGAGLIVLAGATVVGSAIVAVAILAGIVEFTAAYVAPNTIGTTVIPIRTLLVFIAMAGLVVVETLGGVTSWTVPTVASGLIVGVVYLQRELAAWLGGQPSPAPPTPSIP